MDQTGETDKSKRIRVSWKNLNVVKTFLEACIHEITVNGREGGSLKTISWKTVSDVLKDSHNLIVDRKQMKNHYDYLKGKYGAWLLLRNKTGNVYDSSTNMFNLTDEEWEMEMKKNKHVEFLRNTTLPFPDLCAKLFDGAMATGIKSWGPSSNEPMPRDEPHVVEPIVNEEEQDPDILEYTPQPFSTASQSSTPQSSAQPKLDKKKKGKEMMAIVEEEIIGVLKIMAGKHHSKDQKFEVPTFDDCLKKLNEIGWEDTDPLYDVALAIFCEPNDHYRQAWMKMNVIFGSPILGAIGALDGTLVHAIVPINQQTAYRG
uniref:L10-interacting MYB domain-containing protein-like n=1 Tax=Erigeron canadensis TaxID=72917 RepID=UPI001CB984ED|nr:L10-interacting MYB domain-containing protein-like [Erigeron canadensis]